MENWVHHPDVWCQAKTWTNLQSPVYQKMVSTSARHLRSNVWADFLFEQKFPKDDSSISVS